MIYYKLNLRHELISNSSQCFICTDRYMKLESVIILSWIHSNYPKEICPKGNQSWIFIGRTDAKAETPIHEAKNWLIGKDSDAGKDLRQEEKGKTGWNGWMASLAQWIWVWANELVMCREVWRAAVHGVVKSQIWLSDWTELTQITIWS